MGTNEEKNTTKQHGKPLISGFGWLWGFLPFIILAVIIWMIANAEPSKNDCVIGRDSPDCLEGGGGGHPLWNN